MNISTAVGTSEDYPTLHRYTPTDADRGKVLRVQSPPSSGDFGEDEVL